MQFNASVHFGTNHILPPINASGRWSNVPVCQTSHKTFQIGTQLPNVELGASKIDSAKTQVKDPERQEKAESQNNSRVNVANTTPNHKIHNLVACTWASASFETRGKSSIVNDGQDRLREWLAFHLMVGFDHIYVYDNTFAFFPDAIKNNTLQYTTDMFPTDKVTHIPWPAQVCNNNWPGNADPGERSSQYAAETSCRLRFGPYTEWMASFDIDEYLVPMGNYTSLQQLTQKADRDGTKILGFRVVRGKLREDRAQPFHDNKECTASLSTPCLTKQSSTTFLEAQNCRSTKFPTPTRFDRRGKQIFRPDYVQLHFVHYSVITSDFPSRRMKMIYPDETTEATMVHAKSVNPANTFTRTKECVHGNKDCAGIGIACQDDALVSRESGETTTLDVDGVTYCNCFVNHHIDKVWVPKLKEALKTVRTRHVQP